MSEQLIANMSRGKRRPRTSPPLLAGALLSAFWSMELVRWQDDTAVVEKLSWLPQRGVVAESALMICAFLLIVAAVVGDRYQATVISATAMTTVTWWFLSFEFIGTTETLLIPSVCGAIALAALIELVVNLRMVFAERIGND